MRINYSRIAYLIDKEAVGGGNAYIAHERAARKHDVTEVFYAAKGDAKASRVNAWGADLIVVNHLKALLQLYLNPFVHPIGKVVFIVHGIHLRKYDFLPKSLSNRVKRFLRFHLEKYLYGKVDSLVALNQEDLAMLREEYKCKCPIELKPNILPEGFLKPIHKAHDYAFICLARFHFQKGQDILINAIHLKAERLRSEGKRTLFIGGGETFEEMKNLVKKLKIEDLIDFAGEKANASEEMCRADHVIFPSRWEGSPYAVLEALKLGCSVIASACPGNTDFVKDGINGHLFPPSDIVKLSELLVNL